MANRLSPTEKRYDKRKKNGRKNKKTRREKIKRRQFFFADKRTKITKKTGEKNEEPQIYIPPYVKAYNILLAREPQWWHFAFSFLLNFFCEIEEKRAFLAGFCLKNGAVFSTSRRHFFVIFQQKSLQQKSCCKKCAKLPSVKNRSKNERKTPVSFNNRSITAQWYSRNLWLGSHSTYDWAGTLPMTGQS